MVGKVLFQPYKIANIKAVIEINVALDTEMIFYNVIAPCALGGRRKTDTGKDKNSA